jgi:hypothetical protein
MRGFGVWVRVALVAAAVFLSTAPARATPVLRQVNDFETAGSTQGWTNGHPTTTTPPTNVATGGPLGTGDNFLRVSATGSGGPGGKLVAFNRATQWAGNYTTAGVTAVAMDLKNLGPSASSPTLLMRLALQDTAGNRFVDTAAFSLPADGQWHHHVFSLLPADLTRAQGSGTAATALTRVSELRLMHSAGADFTGDQVSSAFGADNITAVPEPGTIGLAGLCAAGLFARRRR